MKLEEIRALCSAATPGPWSPHTIEGDYGAHACGPYVSGESLGYDEAAIQLEADAAFIAAVRTLLPLLLDVVEAAQRCAEPHILIVTAACAHADLKAALAALEAVKS